MTDQQPNDRLLALMEQREKREQAQFEREEKEREQKKNDRDARLMNQMEQDAYVWTALAKMQSVCDHRKGTGLWPGKKPPGPKAKHIDYMISMHTFAGGVTYIKCLKCKHKAFRGDTREMCAGTMDNFIQKGKKVPNPTKLGWEDWFSMSQEENTTNKNSRAEVITSAPELNVA